jgi:hypothetical protein
MKKYKLHQWLPLLLSLVICISCNKRNYPGTNISEGNGKYEDNKNIQAGNNTPAPVIEIPDQSARINKEGEMYYDDPNGYRYWRSADGKYYLDNKYATTSGTAKKPSKKKLKKLHRQNNNGNYSNQ